MAGSTRWTKEELAKLAEKRLAASKVGGDTPKPRKTPSAASSGVLGASSLKRGVFIPGNVPSLKNSKRLVPVRGRTIPIPSKTHAAYVKTSTPHWIENKAAFKYMTEGKKPPYTINFYFVRNSKRLFDYDNAISTLQDMMISKDPPILWLPDDNCDWILPRPTGYEVNKETAGAWIEVI